MATTTRPAPATAREIREAGFDGRTQIIMQRRCVEGRTLQQVADEYADGDRGEIRTIEAAAFREIIRLRGFVRIT